MKSNQIKLQVELKEYSQPFNEQDLLESSFVSSGSEAVVSRQSLVDGLYKWRARAIDDKGNASDWQEFGIAGNADFEVKLVPLYTQVRLEYPYRSPQDEWADLDYADGGIGIYPCAKNNRATIARCGCAITSAVMIARYHIDPDIAQGQDINPKEINNWLKTEPGGYVNGDLNWIAVAKYTNYKIEYEKTDKISDNYTLLDEKLNNYQPVIAKAEKERARGGIPRQHFFVIDNKLASTYTVKDPAWYNTKTLNETTDTNNSIRGYENGFDGLRIYKKGDGIAQSAITFALGSPAELLITDSLGRKLGKDESGVEYNEIPNAAYFEDGFDNPIGENPSSQERNKLIQILEPINGNYALQVIGTDSGSYTIDSVVYDNQGQSHASTLTGNTDINISADYNLNYNAELPQNIIFESEDKEPPIISHTSLNTQYILNSAPIAFEFSAQDNGTGVFSLSVKLDGQPIVSGAVLQFTQIGTHTIEIISEDFVGNAVTEIINFDVVYNFSGFLPPIKTDSIGIYKLGRTLPIKFQLTDANGNYISTATVQLFVAKISDGAVGTDEIPLSTSNADSGNIFRYDITNNQYIYNLSTDTLSTGSWQLKVTPDDGKYYIVVISII